MAGEKEEINGSRLDEKRVEGSRLEPICRATFCSADYSRSSWAAFAANLENIGNFTRNEIQIDWSFGIFPIWMGSRFKILLVALRSFDSSTEGCFCEVLALPLLACLSGVGRQDVHRPTVGSWPVILSILIQLVFSLKVNQWSSMLYMCTVGLKWNTDIYFFNKVSWNTLPWRTFLKLCWVIMKKKSFSSPTPSKQWYAVALHELPAGNYKHPNFDWGGEEEGCIWFCSPEYLIWGQCWWDQTTPKWLMKTWQFWII